MTSLPITSILTAAAAVALVLLSFPVALRRMKMRAATGDAGDETLKRRVRAQGNFIEYTPLALIAIGLVEMGGAPSTTIWALGGALAAGRLLHAMGMLTMASLLRALGMVLTLGALLGSAVLLLKAAYA